ncbi:MAG: hypothetical protein ACRBBW_01780 [Cellvibrionaceae bacterium]
MTLECGFMPYEERIALIEVIVEGLSDAQGILGSESIRSEPSHSELGQKDCEQWLGIY